MSNENYRFELLEGECPEELMGNDGELFIVPTGEPKGELFRSDETPSIF